MNVRVRNICIALGLMGIGGYSLAKPILFPVSLQAIINYPIHTVKAPIQGTVELAHLDQGSSVAPGRPLASIHNEELIGSPRAQSSAQRIILPHEDRELDLRINALEEQKNTSLEIANPFERTLAVSKAVIDPAPMLEVVNLSPSRSENAGCAAPEVAVSPTEHPALEGKLSSDPVRSCLGPSPQADLAAEQLREFKRSRSAASVLVGSAIQSESQPMEQTRSTHVMSPVRGAIWQTLVINNGFVEPGDPLIELLDCRQTIVMAIVSERIINNLHVGEHVELQLATARTRHAGRIVQLLGPSSRIRSLAYALAPNTDDKDEFVVLVRSESLDEYNGGACAIGRTGTVFFESSARSYLNHAVDFVRGWILGTEPSHGV